MVSDRWAKYAADADTEEERARRLAFGEVVERERIRWRSVLDRLADE